MNEPFTAEMAQIVARQERERIIEIISKHADGWQKSHGLNYRAELAKIIESISVGQK